MNNFLHHAGHLLWHSILDTAKILPFLFLTYLLMEFLEHRSGNATEKLLKRSGSVGPLVGGLLGALPQCGFSAAASGLYAGRLITVGTLLAVYLSTSDEMLPILISKGVSPLFMLAVLGCKVLIGLAVGFVADAMFRLFSQKRDPEPQIEDICERENCHCGNRFVLSALKHTAYIAIFLFVVNLCLNTAVELIGEETIASFILNRPVLGNLIASVVGLIPNCASSVVLTELYLSDVISLGCMFSGLLVNAGVGLTVLLRNNRPVRDSLRILAILWGTGLLFGLLIDLTPIATWIGTLR